MPVASSAADNPKPETRNPKLKTTFLTGEYPPMQGGIADHIAHLAHHLQPLEVESSILISRRWLQSHQSTSNNPVSQSPAVHPILPNWGWRCWPGVKKFLKEHRPNVLHIQYQAAAFNLGGWVNWLPWFLRRQHVDIKIVTTFHDLRIPYIFPKAGPLRWKSILGLARHSHAVICTNREDYNQLTMSNTQRARREQPPTINKTPNSKLQSPIHNSQFTPALRAGASETQNSKLKTQNSKLPLITLIPLGSNVEPQPPANFDRTVWRAKYGANGDTLLLAYFGFLNESKGGEELIEALALLRRQGIDAHLLFIGGDVGHADPTNVAYAQKVLALIERHTLANVVHRTGYVELPEVSANLLAADAVVMPYRDGVSFRRTTLIAALRHGCPVISTTPADPSLMPEIVPGQNMLLAPPNNASALAQTIAPLAGNAVLQKKLSEGAQQLGNLFEWSNIAAQTADVYRAITHANPAQLTIDRS